MIETKGLSISFAGNEVLNSVSLEVNEGDSFVVIGKSGTGKSVLLKLICGLLKPDSGDVRVLGESVCKMSDRQLQSIRNSISMVFQGGALFDSMTVAGNIAFGLEQQGVGSKEMQKRIQESLELVGLGGTELKYPAELSGGMRKRAAIARSIATRPKILLYDEPTTGLDPVTSDLINDLMIKLRSTLGMTSVIVTHDMHSASRIADTIAMLDGGGIVWSGSSKDLRAADHPLVAEFIKNSTIT